MWNRRDAVVLATAAAATFGLTVAAFWPRTVHAVDEKPAPTTEVKVPTLDLQGVQVTAALDAKLEHTVIFTVYNTTQTATTAQFAAAAMVQEPSSAMSRIGPMSRQVWNQDYALDLQPGETKTVSVELPAEAFASQSTAQVQSNDTVNNNVNGQAQNSFMRMVPGSGYLTLINKGTPNHEVLWALTLWSGAANNPAAEQVSKAPPVAPDSRTAVAQANP